MTRRVYVHVITEKGTQYKIQDTGMVWTLFEKKHNQSWKRIGSRSDAKLLQYELDAHWIKKQKFKPVFYDGSNPVMPDDLVKWEKLKEVV